MSRQTKHIIHEQILDLRFTDRQRAEHWLAEGGQQYSLRILPLVERACDELSDPGELLQIDTLELDLGELSAQHLQLDFEERFRQVFKAKLSEALQQQSQAERAKAITRSRRELLDFFVRTGALPWWADAQAAGLLRACLQHLVENDPANWKRLLSTWLRNPSHFQRLLYYFTDEDFFEMVKPFSATLHLALPGIHSDWLQILDTLPPAMRPIQQAGRRLLWEGILHLMLEGVEKERDFLRRLLLHIVASTRISVYALYEATARLEKQPYLFASSLPGAVGNLHSETIGKSEAPELNQPKPHKKGLLEATGKKNLKEDLSQGEENLLEPAGEMLVGNVLNKEDFLKEADNKNLKEYQHQGEDNLLEAGELLVGNAGLALLSPYLPRLFENLGWVVKKEFTGEWSPHKAVALLQYLCDGGAESPEYQLPLNKLLCGLPLGALFEPENATLEPSEREQADLLLEAVLEHARPAIGKVSPEGFRNTFLRRRGFLGFEDGHWLLRVERVTFDIVLDRLPWGFKVVKFPWMEHALFVDW